ncbi:MAG: DUF11 domain-containing protein, partial [Micrococcales bacterium]|nr:DUF11 domain-containing protein [Micrococcales bacterium]
MGISALGAARPQHGRGRGRLRLAQFASAAVVSALAFAGTTVINPAPAHAEAVLGPITTKFEIDGDFTGANDWSNIAPGNYGPYPTATGQPSTGILDAKRGTEVCGNEIDSTAFNNDVKPDDPTWPTSPQNVNDKSDLCEAGNAYEIVQVDGQQHVILYQYWARNPQGTGDLTVYQEIEAGPDGRAGNYLIQFDYSSSNEANTISILAWNGSSWVLQSTQVVYDADSGKIAATNQEGTFGEMALDLTASGILPENQCVTASTGDVISRTGNSQSASLQDLLRPPAMDLTNCNSLSVSKVVNGGVPTGSQFDYVISQADGAPVHDGTLTGSVPDQDTSTGSITATIGGGQTHTWNNVIAEPDYLVKEVNLPEGVTLKSIVCTYTDLYEAGGPTKTATLYENGAYTDEMFKIFPSSAAAAPSCVITNTATALTLKKTLVNDNGGTAAATDWTLTATGPTSGVSGATGSDAVTGALVKPGDYDLSESAALPGYTNGTTWACTGTDAAGAAFTPTLTGSTVTVHEGASVTCTITNDDKPAHLTLLKDVVNDNGGTAVDTDWTLTATGPVTASGAEGEAAVTNAPVSAGTYTLTEAGPDGYTMTGLACDGGTFADGKVTLKNGESATCTFTNNDDQGKLTLVKKVVNDNGGTAVDTAWTLTAAGPTAGVTGPTGSTTVTSVPVDAGDYTLSESGGPSGYTPSAWACTGGTLTGSTVAVPNGGDVTCTITNDDVAPQLTLLKDVVNDNGGTAVDTDWTLTATGPVTASGAEGAAAVTNAPVSAGTYTLSEAGPAGYSQTDLTCEGGTLSGDQLTLAVGQSATCTFTNDDQPGKLTLVKEVVNDDRGTSVPTDWTLTATGPTSGVSGATDSPAVTGVTVNAGDYTLSESGPAGYTGSAWSCTGGTVTGSTVTVPNGGDVTCRIVNDDNPVKEIKFDKEASVDQFSAVGQTITYTFTATNTGTAPLTDVTVEEISFSGTGTMSAMTCDPAQPATLAPGATLTCTATYVTTQADLDAGKITNVAHPVTPDIPETPTDTEEVPAATMTLVKTATPTSFTKAGETITYTFVATNTGQVPLTNVTIDETTQFTGTGTLSPLTCDPAQPATLAPGASMTCTATYVTTQADVDAESLYNVATADSEETPPTTDDETVTPKPVKGIAFEKSASTATFAAAGETITYTFTATNTGTSTLHDVTVEEISFTGTGTMSAMTCDPAQPTDLAPAAKLVCTATYVTTAEDVAAKSITNVAGPVTPDIPETPTDTETVKLAKLTLVKTASQATFTKAGETITYTMVATNAGEANLINVQIAETDFSGSGDMSALSCTPAQPTTLAPGATLTCTATYVTTQA